MQFGLFMMPLHPPYRSYADSYDRDLALLVEAALVPFDVRHARTILLDDTAVENHAPPQRYVLVVRRRR